MISALNGAAFTGGVSVFVTGDAGVQVPGAANGGGALNAGNGFYTYAPTAGETNFSSVAFTFVGSGAIPATIQVDTLTPGQFLSLTTGSDLIIYSATDLIRSALYELMVYGPGDIISPDDLDFGLNKLTRLIDNWNAMRRAVWGAQFQSFPVTPGLNPHTIGASAANWATVQRPQRIDGAVYTVGSFRYPIEVDHDAAWWQGRPVATLSTTIPTDLYYQPDWPNGSVYLWPVPSTAGVLEILSRLVVARLGLTDLVTFPPGYLDAIILTLAENMATAHEVLRVPPKLEKNAQDARALIFGNNNESVPLRTRDYGMPGGRMVEGNYLIGWGRK